MKRNHFRQKALLTKTLRRLYTVPAPERKDAFFQSSAYRAAASEALYPPRVPWAAFLQTQMHYIRKWNWILAVCIFAAAILLTSPGRQPPHRKICGGWISPPLSSCPPVSRSLRWQRPQRPDALPGSAWRSWSCPPGSPCTLSCVHGWSYWAGKILSCWQY